MKIVVPKLIVCILLLFTIFACQKDKQIINSPDNYCPACDSCENFPPDSSATGRIVVESYFQRKSPSFNPLNKDEFVYVKELDSNGTNALVIYNMATHIEKVVLYNAGILVGLPRWFANGWIVFGNSSLQIFKVKENGDSLTQLTFIYSNTYPEIYDKDRIIFSVLSGPSSISGNKIINFKGDRLDSISKTDIPNGSIVKVSVNSNLELAGIYMDNIVTYIHSTKAYVTILNDSANNYVASVCWHPNNDDIYFSKYSLGIYKVNKNNKLSSLIKKSCNVRYYNYISLSPDGKKILSERVDASLSADKSTISMKSDIYIMDIDGRNEEKVFK